MAKKGFFLKYDPDRDVLDVSFGKAQKAVSFEQEPEVFFRVDVKSGQLVGLTVLGFKESFLDEKKEINLSSELVAQMARKNGFAMA